MTTLFAKSPPTLANPTIMSIAGAVNVATSARPLVRAAASTTATLTVTAGRSHLITNSGTLSYTVASTGNAGYTLSPGDSLVVSWNAAGSAHVLAGIASSSVGGGGEVVANMVHAAHGRVSGEIGRPLSNNDLFSDTTEGSFPTGVLINVIDTATIQIAQPGSVLTLPVTLLNGGAAFNPTIGRRAWFDTSALLYKQIREADAQSGTPSQLYVLSVGATTFQAIVQPLVPIAWRKFTDFTLTTQNITDKSCGIVGAGVAQNLIVYCNGHRISATDATFNALLGTLNWTGLALAGTAQAGMWIQGQYEPFI